MKKILSLDGGGIRGALTLGYLERIESMLKVRSDNPNLRLCDHFDLIGGTSTGAIIASGLAIGMSAAEIREFYISVGDKIFGKKRKWYLQPRKYLKEDFDFKPFEEELKKVFGDVTLGSDQVKTGLCIVTKRADTLSTWPIINNPKAKFFEKNKGMLLRNVIRASSAAPTYFKPEKLDVGGGEVGTFVDGGVSMANNPALLLFLVATLEGFRYNWEKGSDKLSILSLGSGTYTKQYDQNKIYKKGKLGWAKFLPEVFMEDAYYFNQAFLQYMSKSPTAVEIDSEIGDLGNDLLCEKPLLTYQRFNVKLDKNDLHSLGFILNEKQLESLREMSNSVNKELLYKIGLADAFNKISLEFII